MARDKEGGSGTCGAVVINIIQRESQEFLWDRSWGLLAITATEPGPQPPLVT
jgi:hypothetical protein